MAETHYHPCNSATCLSSAAKGDDYEVSVWVEAPGGVNVVTWPDGGDMDRAEEYAEEKFLAGTPAVVMMRDVIRTPWRKDEQ